MLLYICIGFAILGLIAYFRKPYDMRAAAGSWKPPIPGDPPDQGRKR
ncbi:MAG: hypothetical protein AB7L94_36660 [Kofleriaceae bacterium]|jgi:hypothetical protein